MLDPRADFVGRIQTSATRIRPFGGFFFLCGGPHDARLNPPGSVRSLLWREISSGRHSDLSERMKLAEEIQDWFRDGKYRDLVTFEEHLASLASVILLVVESAGSIAELGAFSASNSITEKLIAVVPEHHFDDDSYIRLGPINRIEFSAGRPTLVLDWHDVDVLGRHSPNVLKLEPMLGEILEAVRSLLAAPRGEKNFKWDVPCHVMILICELCDLFGALIEREIKSYVSTVAPEIEASTVEQYLFLLTSCGLLGLKASSGGRYYHAPGWKSHVIFGFEEGPRIDRDRTRVDVLEFYKRTTAQRFDVVRQLRGAK